MRDLIKTLLTNKLSIEEYFVIELLFYKTVIDAKEADEWMRAYADTVGHVKEDKKTVASSQSIHNLIQGGWIVKDSENRYKLNMKKVELLFLDVEVAGDELFEVYPTFTMINNNNIPLKISKTTDRWGLYTKYWRLIRGRQSEHIEIIKDVKYGNESNMLSMNIERFIDSMFWKELRRYRGLNTKPNNIIDHNNAEDDFWYNG